MLIDPYLQPLTTQLNYAFFYVFFIYPPVAIGYFAVFFVGDGNGSYEGDFTANESLANGGVAAATGGFIAVRFGILAKALIFQYVRAFQTWMY